MLIFASEDGSALAIRRCAASRLLQDLRQDICAVSMVTAHKHDSHDGINTFFLMISSDVGMLQKRHTASPAHRISIIAADVMKRTRRRSDAILQWPLRRTNSPPPPSAVRKILDDDEEEEEKKKKENISKHQLSCGFQRTMLLKRETTRPRKRTRRHVCAPRVRRVM
ncbi:hypothetical protein F2P81_017560 [Scophthalmus maximus]|uniref:Uncharacterized protein n=1 Tax=Scophthalmus maximus TaxID=52904 RepID=A0A6A4SE90_SCOMX|nr:hypothetical protein F2P81_017560 [Scophthalmus maximus]